MSSPATDLDIDGSSSVHQELCEVAITDQVQSQPSSNTSPQDSTEAAAGSLATDTTSEDDLLEASHDPGIQLSANSAAESEATSRPLELNQEAQPQADAPSEQGQGPDQQLPITAESLQQQWQPSLQFWAQNGGLVDAAINALKLDADPPPDQLIGIAQRLASGDSSDIPAIELLPQASMPGAAGAYAASNQRIYLNNEWVQTASTPDTIKVLTEEFGHHLDALLNDKDTAGDEGRHFSDSLTGNADWKNQQFDQLTNDHAQVEINGELTDVEFSRTNTSTTTKFRKAVRFDGASPTGYLISAAGNDPLWSPLARHIHFGLRSNVASGKTANRGQPWASTIVFRRNTSPHSDQQYIWQAGRIAGSNDSLKLSITTAGKLGFEIGDWSGNNLTFESTNTIPLNEWTGLYVDYNGGRTNDEDVNSQRFRIKTVSLSDGSSQDLHGSWSANGDGATAIIGGDLYIGANQSGSKGLSADMASLVFTTLKINDDLPDAEEIGNMTTDPALWIENKVGSSYRMPTKNNGTSGIFTPQDLLDNANTSKHYNSSSATRVYLFGDSTWRSTQAERLQTSGGGINNQIYAGNNTTTDLLVASGRTFNTGFLSNLAIPGIGPTVTNVSSSDANGAYGVGNTITISLTFSTAVTVTGTPQLELETGTSDRVATYHSGTGSNTLLFNYIIQSGDTSADLGYTSSTALSLNGGSIKASQGAANNGYLTLSSPGDATSLSANKNLAVDTTAPTTTVNINSVISDSGISSTDFITSDNNGLTVNATLSTALVAGEILQYSNNNGHSWSTVNNAHISTTAVSFLDSALTSSNTIQFRVTDAAGNSGAAASQAIVVDTTAPTIVITENDVDNALKSGETTTFAFTLSEPSANFIQSDVSVSGGSMSNWSEISPTSYTATFTPKDNSKADAVVSVANNAFTDTAGNANQDEAEANNSVRLSVNTVKVRKSIITSSEEPLISKETAKNEERESNPIDTDGDGIEDAIERELNSLTLHPLDHNKDGIADFKQNNVATFKSTQGNILNLTTRGSFATSINPLNNLSVAPNHRYEARQSTATSSGSFTEQQKVFNPLNQHVGTLHFTKKQHIATSWLINNQNGELYWEHQIINNESINKITDKLVSIETHTFGPRQPDAGNNGRSSLIKIYNAANQHTGTLHFYNGSHTSTSWILKEHNGELTWRHDATNSIPTKDQTFQSQVVLKVLGSELNRPENNSISKTAKINSNTNEGNQGLNLNLFRSLSTDQPRFCLTTRTETSDGTIRGNAAHQHFTKNIHRIDYSFNENETISNALFQYDTSGTLKILGYDPITGLGGILVDRNGNGKADGASFFIQDNSELDMNPNAGIIDAQVGSGTLNLTPKLVATENKRGLTIDGPEGTGLWIRIGTQNRISTGNQVLRLLSNQRSTITEIRLNSHDNDTNQIHELYLKAGEELYFEQSQLLDLKQQTSALIVQHEANGIWTLLPGSHQGLQTTSNSNWRPSISAHAMPNNLDNYLISQPQRTLNSGLVDLRYSINPTMTLQMNVSGHLSDEQRFALVRFEATKDGLCVNGINADGTDTFQRSVKGTMIDPDEINLEPNREGETTLNWTIEAADFGLYAPVMISSDGSVHTAQNPISGQVAGPLQLLGMNHFSFTEDQSRASSDWDHNDLMLSIAVI